MSFRLRIAVMSALLAGLALCGFGLGAWWLIRDIKIGHIDEEVRSAAMREAPRVLPAAEWQRVENRLARSFGIGDANNLLLSIKNDNTDLSYRSAHWPTELDETHLPWPMPQNRIAEPEPAPPEPAPSEPAASNQIQESMPPPDRDINAGPEQRRDRDREPFDAGAGAEERRFRRPPPGRAPPGSEFPGDRFGPRPRPPSGGNFREDPPRGPPPIVKLSSTTAAGHVWRIGIAATDRNQVAIAINLDTLTADMAAIRNAFLIAMPVALIMIGLGAWLLSSRAMRPIQQLTETARKVTADELNQRIAAQGGNREFAELIAVFNDMLERLEKSFNQASRFSADAAHELKTPLAIIQGQIERTMNTVEAGSPIQIALTDILDEVRRLSTISRKLLLLSQADAGRLRIHREPFDLSGALTELVEDTRMLAPHLNVISEIQPGITIGADGNLLRQVLHNLISNAIKYNIDGGWIRISTGSLAQHVEVLVANASNGIAATEGRKIFERFYRSDPSHNRDIEGVGLGLSVSLEIARAHGGNLVLKTGSTKEAQFSLTLPRRA